VFLRRPPHSPPRTATGAPTRPHALPKLRRPHAGRLPSRAPTIRRKFRSRIDGGHGIGVRASLGLLTARTIHGDDGAAARARKHRTAKHDAASDVLWRGGRLPGSPAGGVRAPLQPDAAGVLAPQGVAGAHQAGARAGSRLRAHRGGHAGALAADDRGGTGGESASRQKPIHLYGSPTWADPHRRPPRPSHRKTYAEAHAPVRASALDQTGGATALEVPAETSAKAHAPVQAPELGEAQAGGGAC
jgi:hypothetical protein